MGGENKLAATPKKHGLTLQWPLRIWAATRATEVASGSWGGAERGTGISSVPRFSWVLHLGPFILGDSDMAFDPSEMGNAKALTENHPVGVSGHVPVPMRDGAPRSRNG